VVRTKRTNSLDQAIFSGLFFFPSVMALRSRHEHAWLVCIVNCDSAVGEFSAEMPAYSGAFTDW
jgi:hypothetical protein